MLCEYRVFYIMEIEIVILFHGAVCGNVVMYGSMIGEYDVHQLWFIGNYTWQVPMQMITMVMLDIF